MIYTKRLVDLKQAMNLKQYQIAEALHLSSSTYNNYETEYEIIPINHLNEVCNFFEVSIDYIFEFTNIRNYKKNKKEIDINLFAERIKQLRKENKLNQADLARTIEVHQTAISRYEKKAKIIATFNLYNLCSKYNISADYLLGKTNEPKYLK